jgi:hypothetical protein
LSVLCSAWFHLRELTSLTNPAGWQKHKQIRERIRCEYKR